MRPDQITAAAALAILALGFAQPAKALDFDFSFNGSGSASGTVTGVVTGLSDNATSAVTDVIITGAPAALGFTFPLDVFTAFPSVNENVFDVSSGEIVAADFEAQDLRGHGIDLNASSFNRLSGGGKFTENSLGFAGITFTPVSAVPEPASLSMMIVGLLGALAVRRRGGRR